MKLKALVVDDMRNWLNLNVNLLQKYLGDIVSIDIAKNAREAYNLVLNNQNSPYDIILSDLQMELDFEPEYAGEWFIREVKLLKEYQNTLIILISAAPNIKFIAEKLDIDYISKNLLIDNNYVLKEKLLENEVLK